MRQTLPIHRFFTTILFLAVTTLTWAYDFAVGGIYYNKNTDGTSVTVTYKTLKNGGYSGSVVIPSTVTYGGKTYSVTTIGYRAFYDCTGLTSVTIPNSVTSIGESAFYNCTGLTKAEFASIESLCKIKFSYSFYDPSSLYCLSNPLYYAKHLYINGQEVTDVVIPNSITSINDYAFYGCSGLTSITIPNSVTNIGFYAFDGTAWYNNQPDGLVYAGKVAYKYKGTMPSGTEIVLKEGTLEITGYAFYNCSHLTSVTIPNSVTNIGDFAFYGCSGLKSVTIPNSVTSIGSYAFSGCSGLKSVTIPNSVTSIGIAAFRGCSGLTSVTIGNSVTSIGSDAFYGCYGLTSVTIPNSVTSIGEDAFENCYGLTKAEFASIESLCKIKFSDSDSNPLYYAEHLYINGKEVTDVVIPNSITSINDYAFYNCSGLKSITIPNSVTSIGERAFYNCTGLTSVTIPNSVTSIGDYTFYKCKGLTSVTIPNSVTSIGEDAFSYCSGLTSVIIGNSVTSIGSSAFERCKGLTSVTIGSSVTSIGSKAFYNCSGLTSVTCKSEFVPKTSEDTFSEASIGSATLYVPKSAVNLFRSFAPWNSFGTILPITPTAVESLIADDVSDEAGEPAIYDLQGRRLHEKPARGFYIQGGKKYFVK